jgi:hypothetical protein
MVLLSVKEKKTHVGSKCSFVVSLFSFATVLFFVFVCFGKKRQNAREPQNLVLFRRGGESGNKAFAQVRVPNMNQVYEQR